MSHSEHRSITDTHPEAYRTRPVSVADDLDELVDLCGVALGWDPADPNAEFFRWKHLENPAGASLGRVALDDDGRIVALRLLLRWSWIDPSGRPVAAVRAVDTATHPDHRRRGLFERLTLAALEDLPDHGVGFVFNTPNEQSRPGYLKMGWSTVGEAPLAVLPRRPVLRRGGSTWSGSAKWGVATDFGVTAQAAFADDGRSRQLLDRTEVPPGYRTLRTPEYLRWRYGFGPLHYRVVSAGTATSEGVVVFRLRRRAGRLDLTVCDELGDPRAARDAIALAAAGTGADAVIRSQSARFRQGFVRSSARSQTVVWRPVDDRPAPSMDDLALTQGDLELF